MIDDILKHCLSLIEIESDQSYTKHLSNHVVDLSKYM